MNAMCRKTAIATFAVLISAPAWADGVGEEPASVAEGTLLLVAASEVPSAPNASMSGIVGSAQIPVASSETLALPNVQAAR